MSHTGARVMVVDDDADIREVLQLLLETSGYRVVTAIDGIDACQKIESAELPDLILLDLMMPRMDGEQFLLQLRARADSSIPVVLISGHGAAREKATQLRVSGCLTKPIELDDLLQLMHSVLAPPPA